jgi:large subunit ribosomal protein L17
MRHRKRNSAQSFGREKSQREALLNGLVKSLLEHNRIETTVARAKEVRKLADKLVTFGKNDSTHSRRLAFKILQNRALVKKLFDEIAVRYQDRESGYTRVLKTHYRQGDASPMAIIEFVEESTPTPKKKSRVRAKDLTKESPPKPIKKEKLKTPELKKNETEQNGYQETAREELEDEVEKKQGLEKEKVDQTTENDEKNI